jgi:hypothetical protein
MGPGVNGPWAHGGKRLTCGVCGRVGERRRHSFRCRRAAGPDKRCAAPFLCVRRAPAIHRRHGQLAAVEVRAVADLADPRRVVRCRANLPRSRRSPGTLPAGEPRRRRGAPRRQSSVSEARGGHLRRREVAAGQATGWLTTPPKTARRCQPSRSEARLRELGKAPRRWAEKARPFQARVQGGIVGAEGKEDCEARLL